MPVDSTDITQMPTAGGNVNSPASGTYGEGAALERLKQQLPATTGSGPTAQPGDTAAPMPTPPAGGMSTPPAGGLPSLLLAPTSRPDVPVSTPLDLGAPAPEALNGRQRRMQVLDTLANSPDMTDETREWATLMISKLTSGAAR